MSSGVLGAFLLLAVVVTAALWVLIREETRSNQVAERSDAVRGAIESARLARMRRDRRDRDSEKDGR